MRVIVLLGLSVGFFGFASAQSAIHRVPGGAEQILRTAKWENRILVTCSKSYDAPDTHFFQHFYKAHDASGFRERDILIVSVLDEPPIVWVLSNNRLGSDPRIWKSERDSDVQIMSELGQCKTGQNSIVLIGKDGELKKKWVGTAPSNVELFTLIDAMPMRQQKMRQQDMRQREIREKSE